MPAGIFLSTEDLLQLDDFVKYVFLDSLHFVSLTLFRLTFERRDPILSKEEMSLIQSAPWLFHRICSLSF